MGAVGAPNMPICRAIAAATSVERRAWSVTVADSQPLFREALAAALGDHPELRVTAQASDGPEALSVLRAQRPAVAVLDVDLAGVDGRTVFEELIGAGVETRIVFLSATLDGALVHELVSRGAAGYLSKQSARHEICDAVVAVAQGRTVLSTDAQARLAEHLRTAATDPPIQLSEREQDVLRLIADGLSAPAIGRQLHLSESTVRTHLQHLYEKLGVSERAAAVARAMRRGLID